MTDQNGNLQLLLPVKYANKNFSILAAVVMYDAVKIKIKNKHSTFTKELKIYLKKAFIDMNKPVIICCY
jgi:hypothetical protein